MCCGSTVMRLSSGSCEIGNYVFVLFGFISGASILSEGWGLVHPREFNK